jgi:hypothetical protein
VIASSEERDNFSSNTLNGRNKPVRRSEPVPHVDKETPQITVLRDSEDSIDNEEDHHEEERQFLEERSFELEEDRKRVENVASKPPRPVSSSPRSDSGRLNEARESKKVADNHDVKASKLAEEAVKLEKEKQRLVVLQREVEEKRDKVRRARAEVARLRAAGMTEEVGDGGDGHQNNVVDEDGACLSANDQRPPRKKLSFRDPEVSSSSSPSAAAGVRQHGHGTFPGASRAGSSVADVIDAGLNASLDDLSLEVKNMLRHTHKEVSFMREFKMVF